MQPGKASMVGFVRSLARLVVGLAVASALPALAQRSPEILVSSQQDMIDAEFSQERGQIVWVDRDSRLWVAKVNQVTGAIIPSDGKGQLVDPDALRPSEVLSLTYNGPEWLPSADGVHIVYTKFLPGRAHTLANARLAIARQGADGTWESRTLEPDLPRNAPYASTDVGDPAPRITYVDPLNNHYWREVDNPIGEELIPGVPRGPKSVRFVQGARAVVFVAPADGVQQVFGYDLDTKELQQLTFDAGDKDLETVPWMWAAPEFNGRFVLMTVVDRKLMRFYRQQRASSGEWAWLPFSERLFPDATTVWSPEPFVYQGQSYVFTGLAVAPDEHSSQIWFVNVDPAQPFMRRLDDPSLIKGRMDPEAFVTDLGPFIYFNRFDSSKVPGKPLCPTCHEGVFRVHTGLPPPR